MQEPFLINPPKRHHRRNRVRKHHRNPFGESLMIAGANPFRGGHRRHRGLFGRNSFFGHAGAHSKATKKGDRKFKRNARRKHYYRRNPASMVQNIIGYDFLGNLPMLATGAASLIATTGMPGFLNMQNVAWKKYGIEAATIIGGGFAIRKFAKSSKHSTAWIIGGSAAILAELIRTYVLPMIPGMAAFKGFDYAVGTPAYGPGYSGVGDYRIAGDAMGAFPDTGFGAFPDSQVGYSYEHPEQSFEYGAGAAPESAMHPTY